MKFKEWFLKEYTKDKSRRLQLSKKLKKPDWSARPEIFESQFDEIIWIKFNEYNAENTRFREYHLGGNPRNGMLTVDLNKNGYQIRNVFVDKSLQRKGFASLIYYKLNSESIRKTGKPLRSSEIGYGRKTGITSLSDQGVKLWEKLVSNRDAIKNLDHYSFK